MKQLILIMVLLVMISCNKRDDSSGYQPVLTNPDSTTIYHNCSVYKFLGSYKVVAYINSWSRTWDTLQILIQNDDSIKVIYPIQIMLYGEENPFVGFIKCEQDTIMCYNNYFYPTCKQKFFFKRDTLVNVFIDVNSNVEIGSQFYKKY